MSVYCLFLFINITVAIFSALSYTVIPLKLETNSKAKQHAYLHCPILHRAPRFSPTVFSHVRPHLHIPHRSFQAAAAAASSPWWSPHFRALVSITSAPRVYYNFDAATGEPPTCAMGGASSAHVHMSQLLAGGNAAVKPSNRRLRSDLHYMLSGLFVWHVWYRITRNMRRHFSSNHYSKAEFWGSHRIYNLEAPLGGPTFVISLYSRLLSVSLCSIVCWEE